MNAKVHIAFGLFSGAVLTSYYQMSDASFTSDIAKVSIAAGATLLGSLAPDLDAPGSPVSRLFPFVSKPIQRKWPHRTLLHSLMGAVLASGAVYFTLDFLAAIFPLPPNVSSLLWTFFFNAYASHLVVDSLTITGIKWLWPYQRAFAYPSVSRYRIRTGDKKPERYYTLFFLCLFAAYLPVLRAGGASRYIHKTFKNFQMAKEDYLKAINIETYLTFEGSYQHDRIPVSGKSLILEAKEDYFIIYFNGKVLAIGDHALVLGTRFICDYTKAAPQTSKISIVNQPMDSILAQIPDDILISGELRPKKEFQVSNPIYTTNDFPTIKITASAIEFIYASKKDISRLVVRLPEDVRRLEYLVLTLNEDIASRENEIKATTKRLSAERDLLIRYNLQKEVADLKSKKNVMEKSLASKTAQLEEFGGPDIDFSGELDLRKVPSLVQYK